MAKDDQTPATKADLKAVRHELNTDIGALHHEIEALRREFKQDFHSFKDEIIRHFDVAVETIRHDLKGANRDEIETIKDRVTRLEHHTGLLPA